MYTVDLKTLPEAQRPLEPHKRKIRSMHLLPHTNATNIVEKSATRKRKRKFLKNKRMVLHSYCIITYNENKIAKNALSIRELT